mmetsp:Transcript_51518/g.76379  ORF Transcript_51518/g.76379 Transcript_51518/m.76379 type:complete len:219 (-) Transcript_51518:199-855(-)
MSTKHKQFVVRERGGGFPALARRNFLVHLPPSVVGEIETPHVVTVILAKFREATVHDHGAAQVVVEHACSVVVALSGVRALQDVRRVVHRISVLAPTPFAAGTHLGPALVDARLHAVSFARNIIRPHIVEYCCAGYVRKLFALLGQLTLAINDLLLIVRRELKGAVDFLNFESFWLMDFVLVVRHASKHDHLVALVQHQRVSTPCVGSVGFEEIVIGI